MWRRIVPHLGAHRTLIWFDLLGTVNPRNRDFRSLILIDPVAIGPSGSALGQAAKDHQAVFADLPAYIHAAILRAYIGGAVLRTLADEEMHLYMQPWLGESGQAAFYRQIAQMSDRFTDEIEHRFAEVRCPVTILWGEHDEWIPIAKGKDLAQRIPRAGFRSIPHAKHLIQRMRPKLSWRPPWSSCRCVQAELAARNRK